MSLPEPEPMEWARDIKAGDLIIINDEMCVVDEVTPRKTGRGTEYYLTLDSHVILAYWGNELIQVPGR